MHRGLCRILLLAIAAGCSSGGDARTEEIWVIDLDTYGDEVDASLADLQLLRPEVEQRVLDYLAAYFSGLPIRFELGAAVGDPTKSSICVRNGADSRVGRGVLDFGNSTVVHDCGEPDGTSHGAFINVIASIHASEVSVDEARPVRTDVFARLLAMVLAHEIGHGVGLAHSTGNWGSGDLMRAFPVFRRDLDYYFNGEHAAQLAQLVLFGG